MNPILFQDRALLVCRKEAGQIAEESEADASLPRLLREITGAPVFPVHRLDRETAGLMVFARTKKAAASLSGAFQNGGVEKEYLCLTTKKLLPETGEMEDFLRHDKIKNRAFAEKSGEKGAKPARLAYSFLAEKDGRFLFRVRLFTGRTHQIRAQFSLRGAPLLGDRKYGGAPGVGIALFCAVLAFPHPETGERLSFSLLPEGMPWLPFLPELSED